MPFVLLNFASHTSLLAKKAIDEKGLVSIEKLGMSKELYSEFVGAVRESRKTSSDTCLVFYLEFAL